MLLSVQDHTKLRNHLILSTPDDNFLKALAVYKYLTAWQTTRLFYSHGTLTTVQTRYKRLADAGYVCRIPLPATSRVGSGPYVYTLASAGSAYLRREHGIDVGRRQTPAEERGHGLDFWSHLLALNDLLLGLAVLTRTHATLRVGTLLHDLDLRREPLMVQLAAGQRQRLIPDALLTLELAGVPCQTVLIELHRGTNHQVRTRQQFAKLIAWVRAALGAGIARPTVAFFTTAGDMRLGHLREWVEAELAPHKDLARAFRLAAGTPATIDPTDLACAPLWFQPFRKEPVPLLNRPLRRSVRAHPTSRPLVEARGKAERRGAGVNGDARARRRLKEHHAPGSTRHERRPDSPVL
jgi:hypothetical protein